MFIRLDGGAFLEYEVYRQRWAAYRSYLEMNEHVFAPETYAFVTAPWYYNPNDPRCPHDATLNAVTVSSAHAATSIHLLLRGGGEDTIEFLYTGVKSYEITCSSRYAQSVVGQFITDEITLSKHNETIHGIDFAFGDRWIIVCASITYRYNGVAVAKEDRASVDVV